MTDDLRRRWARRDARYHDAIRQVFDDTVTRSVRWWRRQEAVEAARFDLLDLAENWLPPRRS